MGVDVKVALEKARSLQAEGLVDEALRAFAAVMEESADHRTTGFVGFVQCYALLWGREKAFERAESLIELWDLAGSEVDGPRRYLEMVRAHESANAGPSASESPASPDEGIVELELEDIDLLEDTASIPLVGVARPRSLAQEQKSAPARPSDEAARLPCAETAPDGDEGGARVLSLFGDRPLPQEAGSEEDDERCAEVHELESKATDRSQPPLERNIPSVIVDPAVVEPSPPSKRPVRVKTQGGRLSLRTGLARGSGESDPDDDKDFAF